MKYVNLDDGLKVTCVQDDIDFCARLLQNKLVETENLNEESHVVTTAFNFTKK